MSLRGLRVAGHLQAHVESFGHFELLLHFAERSFGGVDGEGGSHLAREIEAEGIEIGDDDVARSGVAHDGNGHDADGASAGDEHVFAEDRKRKRGVDGVAEGVEDRGDFKIDAGMMAPDVGHGQRDEFGKGTRAIDAYALGGHAQVAPTGEAVAAASADHVAFAADDVAGEEVVDVGADGDDFADEFVADGHGDGNGFLRPVVPVVDVDVGSADAGVEHADEDVVNAHRGFGDVFQPKSALGPRLDQRFHSGSPVKTIPMKV